MSYAQKIIERCGGARALARALGRPASTVHSWGDRGSIPDEAKAEIMAYSQSRGLGLTAGDFFPVELMPQPIPNPDEDAA